MQLNCTVIYTNQMLSFVYIYIYTHIYITTIKEFKNYVLIVENYLGKKKKKGEKESNKPKAWHKLP